MRRGHTTTQGFTLLELIFVIVLVGIISVVITKTLFQSYQVFQTGQNISEADWQAYLALDRLTQDIHNIRSASDMTTITANQFTFVDKTGTTVQYQFSSNALLRNSQTLAAGIQSFAFSYLDQNGATTAVTSNVRYVGINITTVQQTVTVSFATLIATRGMK